MRYQNFLAAVLLSAVAMQADAQMDVIKSVPGYNVAAQKEEQLKWGLGMLKDMSGMMGASMACNNKSITDDSTKAYRAAFKSLIKHEIIKKEDGDYILDMNAKYAVNAKAAYLKPGHPPCSDLSDAWMSIKQDYGLH